MISCKCMKCLRDIWCWSLKKVFLFLVWPDGAVRQAGVGEHTVFPMCACFSMWKLTYFSFHFGWTLNSIIFDTRRFTAIKFFFTNCLIFYPTSSVFDSNLYFLSAVTNKNSTAPTLVVNWLTLGLEFKISGIYDLPPHNVKHLETIWSWNDYSTNRLANQKNVSTTSLTMS